MPGIYLHIPFCEKKCIYCDFYSITNKSNIDQFINALKNEILLFLKANPEIDRKIETIYFGGGTPSLLEPKHIAEVVEIIYNNFDLSSLCEFTIECNPGTDFIRKLPEYKSIGINRISIGVQSLNESELKFLGRIHTSNEATRSIESALDFFENVSVDIIFSIPNQTEKSLLNTLKYLLEFDLKHISAYSLIYEEGTPLFNQLQKGKVFPKNENEDYELYRTIQSFLLNRGFEQYEVSNYAKQGFKSLHNLGYWQHKEYYGFGPSAHSFYQSKRVWNVRNLKQYLAFLQNHHLPIEGSEILDEEKKMLEKIMLGLRSEGICLQKFKEDFDVDIQSELNEVLQEWIALGFAKIENGFLKLTPNGYFVCDKLTVDLTEKVESCIKIKDYQT
ncbi:radical SAM family heme chaperone HemW [Bacteroidetes/Chlorobi group bacterium Naka2016]|jgi:oxygen-independent coproporphyrinogen-3 oxidase|nr:MAG: radical SAM family heme chaperone HemW [Bacteroidetes/Chlorobi group bacterium Naka2016]